MNKGSRNIGMIWELDCLTDTNYVGVQYIRKSIQRSSSYLNQQIEKLVVFTLPLHGYRINWCKATESQCLTMEHDYANTQIESIVCFCLKWFRVILGELLRSKIKDERNHVQIQIRISISKAAWKRNPIKVPLLLKCMLADAQTHSKRVHVH